jgi:hypothetical protein
MPENPGAPRPKRPPLPTLTEDDVRSQGERRTLPPPVPIGELVEQMMGEIDGDSPPTRRPEGAGDVGGYPQTPGHVGRPPLVTFEEVSVEADVIDEIGEAYLARLGSGAHIPFTRMTREAALRVPLDHWAGFVLSLVDGRASVDYIIDAASIPEIEALRLLCELREQGIIDVRAP